MHFTLWSKCKKKPLEAIRNIFFSTSTKTVFASEQQREAFFQKYLGLYIDEYPDQLHLALDDSDSLIGYLSGCRSTFDLLEKHPETSSVCTIFEDLFPRFPAHLHINTHPNFSGKGVGTLLMNGFLEELKRTDGPGVHIVTSPSSRNVNFYLKNGFTHQVERILPSGASLLFMGRSLTS